MLLLAEAVAVELAVAKPEATDPVPEALAELVAEEKAVFEGLAEATVECCRMKRGQLFEGPTGAVVRDNFGI